MRKIIITKPGGYDKLKVEEFPDPKPSEGEILVKIKAAGINYADIAIRWGLYESAKKFVGYPITPGFEYAGKIEAIGEGVEGWAIGEDVFGVSLFGAYAEKIVVPAHQVFRLPRGFSHVEAAGFPAVFATAYHALYQQILLRPKSKILVHSAAGGVGGALLQLGKVRDCMMVGVVGASHKVETAKALGADHVIDKSSQDLWAEAEKISPEGYDVVLDANGYTTLKDSWEHVRPTGKLIIYGFHTMLPRKGGKLNWPKLVWGWLKTPRFNPIDLPNQNKSIVSFNLSWLFGETALMAEGMNDLIGWIEEGKIKPPVVKTFKMEEVAKAHAFIESAQSVGKLILIMEE